MNATHAGFILAAYLICIGVVGGLILATWLDHRRLKRALAQFEGRRGGGAP